MNFKGLIASVFLILICVTVNTENKISNTISAVASNLIGSSQDIEQMAVEVSLSFANIPKNTSPDFLCPISNPIITSNFGNRLHPTTNEYTFHSGIDIATFDSQTVCSIADGTVTYIGYDDNYGNYIKIAHENGYQSLYAHLSEIYDKTDVLQGEIIGVIGKTGNATAEHLHLEINYNDKLIDPSTVINFYEN